MKKNIVWQAVFLTTAVLGINELENGQIVRADEADSESVSQNQPGSNLQAQTVPLKAQKEEATNNEASHENEQTDASDENIKSAQQVVKDDSVNAPSTEQAAGQNRTEAVPNSAEPAITNGDTQNPNSNGSTSTNPETNEDTQQQDESAETDGNNISAGDSEQQPAGNESTGNTQQPEIPSDGGKPAVDDQSQIKQPSRNGDGSIQGTVTTVGDQKSVTISDLSNPVPIYNDTTGNTDSGTFLIPDSEWTIYSEYRDASGVNWLQVGANQWIKDVFSKANDPKKNEDGTGEDELELIAEEPIVPPLKGQQINAPANFTVTIGADSQNVWEYFQGEGREVVRQAAANSTITVKFIATDAQGIMWYGLSKYEWITADAKEGPLNFSFDNPGLVKAPSNMVFQINNGGKPLEVWSYYKTQYRQKVGKSLDDGTKWKVFKIATDEKYVTWYNLGGDQWIPADPDLFMNPVQIPSLVAGQVMTLPKNINYTVLNNGNPQTVWDWFETSERESVQKIQFASRWKVIRIAMDHHSKVWFDLGNNQWARTNGDTIDDLDALPNMDLGELASNSISAPSGMTFKVNNGGQAVAIWNTYKGFRQQTGKTVADNSSWAIYKIARDTNGLTWYNLGGDQWIPRSVTLLNKKIEIPNPDALQVVAAPSALTYTVFGLQPKAVYDYYTGPDTEQIKTLPVGSTWNVTRVAKDEAGDLWFELGTYQWVSMNPFDFKLGLSDSNHHGDVSLNTTYTIKSSLAHVKIWSTYKSFRQDTGRTLANGSKWKVYAVTQDQDAFTWYNLGGSQWVSSSPEFIEGQKKVTLPIAANTTLPAPSGLSYTVISGNTDQLWTNYNDTRRLGNTLGLGTSWKVFNVARDAKGQIWYDLGGSQWLNRNGFTFDDISAIHFDEIIAGMLVGINEAIEGFKGMNAGAEQMIAGFKQMNDALGTVQVGMNGMNDALGTAQGGMNGMNGAISGINVTVSQMITELTNVNNAMRETNIAAANLINQFSSLNTAIKQTNQSLSSFTNSLVSVNHSIDNLNASSSNLSTVMRNNSNALAYLNDNISYFSKYDLKTEYMRSFLTNMNQIGKTKKVIGKSVSAKQWNDTKNRVTPVSYPNDPWGQVLDKIGIMVGGADIAVQAMLGEAGGEVFLEFAGSGGALAVAAVPEAALVGVATAVVIGAAMHAYEQHASQVQYFNPNPTSRTFGQPVSVKMGGQTRQFRVDAEIDSNKIQIQSGGGKNSFRDYRISPQEITDKNSIYNLIDKELKRVLSQKQLDKVVNSVWSAYRYLIGK